MKFFPRPSGARSKEQGAAPARPSLVARLWSLNGAPRVTLSHASAVLDVDFSPGGELVLTSTAAGLSPPTAR